MSTVLARTNDMSREAWLQARKAGIGSSDAAAVAGLDRWKSPLDIYYDKISEHPTDDETSEAARWGLLLEDVIAQEFAERTGLRVQRRNAILRHPEHTWMLANLDRVTVPGQIPVELKTTSAYNRDEWADERLPDRVTIQVLHQIAVTGAEKAHVACLIGGQRLIITEVARDEEAIASLVEIERAFWHDHVLAGLPPEPDGSPAATELVRALYPEARAEAIELPTEAQDLVQQYQEAHADTKAAEKRKAEAQNRLCLLLGEAERGWAGSCRVDWSNVTSRRLDTARLRSEVPGLYDTYSTENTTRRFAVRAPKEG